MGYRRVIVETSMDSFMIALSAVHFGRPGLGDRMFDNAAGHGPSHLSPPKLEILIHDFVFSDDYSHSYRPGLLLPYQFRPLFVLNIGSVHSPADDDDTTVSVSSCKPHSLYLTEVVLDARKWSHSALISWLYH